MRGADGGPWRAHLRRCRPSGPGCSTTRQALDGAVALVRDWTEDERQALRDAVPRLGLKTPFRGGTLRDVGREMVALALGGLKRRARRDRNGDDERKALANLVEIVEEGRSPADRLLASYNASWAGNIDRVFDTQAF